MADIRSKELEEMEKEVFSQDVKLKRMEEFVSPESLYQELIASVRKYHPSNHHFSFHFLFHKYPLSII